MRNFQNLLYLVCFEKLLCCCFLKMDIVVSFVWFCFLEKLIFLKKEVLEGICSCKVENIVWGCKHYKATLKFTQE